MYESEFEARRPKRHRAVVEIKPDNPAARQAGLMQLARPDRQLGLPPRLVVYRDSGRPREYTVLVSRPGEVARALRAPGRPDASLLQFDRIGTVDFTPSEWTLKLPECPTELGRRIERKICDLYRQKVGGNTACKDSASANGPDYAAREAAEFYLELARELSAELESRY